MWPKLKKYETAAANSQIPRGEEVGRASLLPKLNVNEEYMRAFRSVSYMEIWNKIRFQIRYPRDHDPSTTHLPSLSPSSSCISLTSSSSSPSLYNLLRESLLEPTQDSIDTILEQQFSHFVNPDLRDIARDFFSSSAEAFSTCILLLECINQVKTNHATIQNILNQTENSDDFSIDQFEQFMADLSSFVKLDNPLTLSSSAKFQTIHDLYNSMQKKLRERKKKLMKRLKVMGLLKKVSVAGLLLACGAITIVGVLLAANGFAGVLTAPLMVPAFRKLIKKRMVTSLRAYRSGFLKGSCAQLDAAARGAYILERDFDTMSRMVTRLHDEIEHTRAIVRICLRNKESHLLREILGEFRMNHGGFLEQISELEEHVYLCFLTINKARGLVVQEITMQSGRKR